MNSMHRTLAAVALLGLAPVADAQQRLSLTPDQDNSIYEEPAGTGRSNGAYRNIFAGNTQTGLARRALLRFDIAGNVPAGATITSAALTLQVTLAPLGAPGPQPFTLHTLTTAWGEGASNSGDPGGMGAFAVAPDATWDNAMEPASPWTTPGGDFVALPVSTVAVPLGGSATFSSTAMVADVQAWLDGGQPNHGWILRGDETGTGTARRFGSREQEPVNLRPLLVIEFTSPNDPLGGGPFPTFCDASDLALASCPCANPGNPDSGCDIPAGTGGVKFEVIAQRFAPSNRATARATGFPPMATPSSIVIRAPALDPGSPVVFGDGLRCVGVPLVRLASTFANAGTAIHTFGNGAMAGSGSFFYQAWFRSTPIMFCDPAAAFNLSNGQVIVW